MRLQAGPITDCERRHLAHRANAPASPEPLPIEGRMRALGARSPVTLVLGAYVALSEGETTLVESALGELRRHVASGEIRVEDGINGRALAVAAGWACEAALLDDGRRQIVSLVLPGDILDLDKIRRRGLVAVALTPVRTRDVGRLIVAMGELDPELSALGCAWKLNEEAADGRLISHVIRLGRLSAYQRVVDLVVELHGRQQRAGVADARSMSLPLTQEALADYLGLSIVHVNRTLQQLRRDGVIAYQAGRVTMADPARLAAGAAHRT